MKELIPKGNIAILIISSCIASLGNAALSFSPLYFTSLGGTVALYGTITTFATLMAIPSTIAGGAIVQRYNLKKIVIMTAWIGPCGLLGYYFSHSWITLSIIMLLGAAGSLGSTATRQLVADTTIRKNRTAQLSLYQTFSAIPSIVSPLIGGYMIHTMGPLEGFRLGVLIALVISPIPPLLLIRFLREGKPLINSYPKGNPNPVASVINCYRGFYTNLTLLPKVLVPLLAAYVGIIVANSSVNPYLIFYATSVAKLDTFQWGAILSLQVLFACIARTPIGVLSDRFDKRKVMVLSVAMTAPIPIFLAFVNSFWGILGILLVMVATGINYRPTHEALQIEITPRERRPALFAIYDVLTNLSTSAGTMIGAILFTISYAIPFYGFTVIEATAAVILGLSFFSKKAKERFVAITPQ